MTRKNPTGDSNPHAHSSYTSDQPTASETPTLAAALLELGYWPIAIAPGQKNPIGKDWGKKPRTPGQLEQAFQRHPGAGLGI
jgi:hypothetical protein